MACSQAFLLLKTIKKQRTDVIKMKVKKTLYQKIAALIPAQERDAQFFPV